MTRTALVPLATYPEAPNAECLDAVVSLADKLGCGIHAMPLVAHFPKVANALSSLLLDVPDMIRKAEAQSRKASETMSKALESAASAAGVACSAASRGAGPELAGDIAAEEARYHDLSILRVPAGNETCRGVAEAVVFGSGRPVVILPPGPVAGDPRQVVIAWDGSRVAARAAADALALLGEAAEVTIVSVLNEKPLPADDLGDRLAARLVERGIRATAEPLELEDQPIGATLQDFALRKGAGMLVMGAYGHSRLRDFVLGGATRTILEDLRLPVLMSH